MCSGCRVRTLQTHSMRTRPAARTRTAADRCDRDLWPKRISQLYYDSGFQVQEASAEWDDSRSARTGGIHSLQWKVRRAFLLFTLILLCSAAFLGFGYFCLWKHVKCIWIQWQKKPNPKVKMLAKGWQWQWLTKTDHPGFWWIVDFCPNLRSNFISFLNVT